MNLRKMKIRQLTFPQRSVVNGWHRSLFVLIRLFYIDSQFPKHKVTPMCLFLHKTINKPARQIFFKSSVSQEVALV